LEIQMQVLKIELRKVKIKNKKFNKSKNKKIIRNKWRHKLLVKTVL